MKLDRPLPYPYAALHIAVFLFGFTAILGRLIEANELTVVWYRMLITVLSLALFPGLIRKVIAMPLKDLLKIAGIGVIVAVHWVSFFGAVKYSNVSVALCGMASASFFASILEPLIFRTKIKWYEMFLGSFVILGFVVTVQYADEYLLGLGIAIFSAFCAALFSVLNKTMVDKHDVFAITMIEFLAGVIFLSALMPFYGLIGTEATLAVGWSDLGYLIVLALLCTTFAYTLTMKVLQQLSAFSINLAINLEPVYGFILAFLIFREDKELDPGFYLGSAIIITAVFLHPILAKRFK